MTERATDMKNSRRGILGTLAATTVAAASINSAALAADEPRSVADLKKKFPVLASTEGVWAGTFRRLDANSKIVEEFKSKITKRYLSDDQWPKIYHQTNEYEYADGRKQKIETFGEYRDGKVHFESARVKGWQMDDPSDPFGRTIFLHMVYTANPDQYVYEMINVSDDGKYRTRVTQFLKAGRTVQRTLIDEEKVADDWRQG
jgi:hypothetical protein